MFSDYRCYCGSNIYFDFQIPKLKKMQDKRISFIIGKKIDLERLCDLAEELSIHTRRYLKLVSFNDCI